jgi:hypothetical protein
VEDRDNEPAANLLGVAGGRPGDFRRRMDSDGAGAPAGFGWGGGGGPGWSGGGPGLAAMEAVALAWPRPCLAAARSWGSRGGDGD